MARFDGDVVLITGGARGMGASHAKGFADAGAHVVIGDVRGSAGASIADELGERVRFLEHDVASPEAWEAVTLSIEEELGPISVLVNNAAVPPTYDPTVDHDVDAWRRIVDVNLIGPFLGIRAVAPSMRRRGGGAIINISSVDGIVGGGTGTSAYTASKWGLRGLSKTASIELGHDNIRVNTVFPGRIHTPMTTEATLAGQTGYPIPRLGSPDEVTRLVMFLARDASFCTGADFTIDGGLTAGFPR